MYVEKNSCIHPKQSCNKIFGRNGATIRTQLFMYLLPNALLRFKLFYTSQKCLPIPSDYGWWGKWIFSNADCLRWLHFVSTSIWLYSWVVEFSLSNVRFNTQVRILYTYGGGKCPSDIIIIVLLYEIFYSCVNDNYTKGAAYGENVSEYFFCIFSTF